MRIVILGAVLGGLAVVLLRGVAAPGQGARAVQAARSPDQERTEEIFRANVSAASDADLTAAYQSINVTYFESRLPAVRIRWESRLDEVGPLIAEGFRMGGVTDGQLILINPAVRESDEEFRRVLCHEVAHIAAMSERAAHGPIFQAYLRQLLDKGAFTGIVATEAQKQQRRQELDRRSADLTAQADLLARARTDLEADASVLSEVDRTARTNDFNDRVRKHNDAIVEFNRSIEEYNLMVSYPDGLDRERLARRPSSQL